MNQFACISSCLPEPPITTTTYLRPDADVAPFTFDLSALPPSVQASIIGRLPVMDVFHIGFLVSPNKEWLRAWKQTPLVLDDVQLSPSGDPRLSPYHEVLGERITRVLDTHPGPFASVRLTKVNLRYTSPANLNAWVNFFATKRLKELVVTNEILDHLGRFPLPDGLLRCPQLQRLSLASCHFPATTLSAPQFLHLRELGLFGMDINGGDLEAVLEHCSLLARLWLVDYSAGFFRLPRRAGRLRIVVVWDPTEANVLREVDIPDAPVLERLILGMHKRRRGGVKVIIRHTQRLEVLGYLDLSGDKLTIHNTAIKTFTNEDALPNVPSLKTLALKLSFTNRAQVHLFKRLLKCFPNLETLHIRGQDDVMLCDPAVNWEKHVNSISCVRSNLKTVVFEAFQGGSSERSLAASIFRNAERLKVMRFIVYESCPTDAVGDMLKTLWSNYRSANARVLFSRRDGRCTWTFCDWSFHNASNMALIDPFYG